MNLSHVLTKLNHFDLQNRNIDQKFMTSNTFQKKYKTKDVNEIINSVKQNSLHNISD